MSGRALERVLSRRDVLALAFGAMIGWGWVVLAGEWVGAAGALGAALAFGGGGVVIALIGLTYAELVAAMPEAGGEHVYSQRAFGDAGSFLCTWSILLGYVSVVAFEAVALPAVLEHLVPGFRRGLLWEVAGAEVHASWAATGMAAAALMMALNVLGVRPAALLQRVVAVAIAAGGALLVAGGALHGGADALAPLFAGGAGGIASVLMMVPFMFVGFDVIPQAAEEIRLPQREIGALLVVSVALAVAFYVLAVLGVAAGLGPAEADGAELPTALAAETLWGGAWAGNALVLAGLAGILTSWNAFLIGGSRAVFAMARSNMLPPVLGGLSARRGTPVPAIGLVGAFSLGAPLLGREALVWLANAGGLGIVVGYALVALAFLKLRRDAPEMARPFRLPRGGAVGAAALALALGLAALYLPGSPSALVWPAEWGIVLGWAALGLALYRASARRRSVRRAPAGGEAP